MQNATEMRGKLFTMRVSDDEWERFDRVAKHHGLSMASTVRMLMKREAEFLDAASRTRGEQHFGTEHAIVLDAIAAFAARNRVPGRFAAAKLFHNEFSDELRQRAQAANAELSDDINRVVSDLVLWGYLRKLRGKESDVITYELTGKERGK